ncbi:MAG: MmcQ/YjbR family DNA-binding protein [Phycisphaerae bacterium]
MATGRKARTESAGMKALRRFVLRLPEVEEGASCVNRAFRARGKAFAYLGMKADHYKLMVKPTDSVEHAQALARERPDAFDVGKHGWTTIRLPHTQRAPKGLLEAWIEESYRALAPAPLVKRLSGGAAR